MGHGGRIVLSSSTLEYIRVKVEAIESGVVVNPTSSTVEFAFPPVGQDISSATWVAGSWETSSGYYYARTLVGAGGGVVLADGTYEVWVRVNQGVEFPHRKTGLLDIL